MELTRAGPVSSHPGASCAPPLPAPDSCTQAPASWGHGEPEKGRAGPRQAAPRPEEPRSARSVGRKT